MTHRDTVRHRNGAELARGAACLVDPLLHRLRLAHQRDVAWRSLIPAGRHAYERLVDLLFGEAHRVVIRPMGCALRPNRNVAAWQFRLVECLGVHMSALPVKGSASGFS